ncbi:MAG: hypothetical protein EOO05_19895 [Chitinophagaceae bacterium]|nr:MAG: hypothetical protein EOO05_19895 [Chitinophagaceae bacterium]
MKVKSLFVSFCACAILAVTIAFKAQGRQQPVLPDPETGVLASGGFTDAEIKAPDVEAWFFRAVSGYPAAIAFEPVVLFKNGEYYDVGEDPVESMDVEAEKAKRPKAWGKWRKAGDTWYLTNSQGKEHDYKLGSGNWFPAFAYTGSPKLKKAYEKTSGGDYGNGTNALFKSRINFIDDTHFTQGEEGGVITPNSTAWNKTADAGTYKIKGHSIEMTLNSGKVVKRSFAFGASGTPPKATSDMIFIGGDAYTDQD